MRYLLYQDYESGLCNNWMGLELAAGLSHLTERRLVLYGSAGTDRTLLPARGGGGTYTRRRPEGIIDNGRRPHLLDLLDELPFSMMTFPEFMKSGDATDRTVMHCDAGLTNRVFVPQAEISCLNTESPDHPTLLEFCDGREVLTDSVADVWHHTVSNLGFYSRVFFRPQLSLLKLFSALQPGRPYRELAEKIVRALGIFNGVHVRLTDFRQFLPQTDDYPSVIAETLRSIFSQDQLLVISTDESAATEFFKPITAVFRRSVFLDEFILENFSKEFRQLPFRDEQTLGFVCNQVLWNCRDFAGTVGSTFTGFIHRHWYQNLLQIDSDVKKDFKFVSSGIPGAGSHVPEVFSSGVFLESRPGAFSWNRVRIPRESSVLSWYREWPESTPDQSCCRTEPWQRSDSSNLSEQVGSAKPLMCRSGKSIEPAMCNGWFLSELAEIILEDGGTLAVYGSGDRHVTAALRDAGLQCDTYDWIVDLDDTGIKPTHTTNVQSDCAGQQTYDWILCCELGRDLSQESLDCLLATIHDHNKKGIVLRFVESMSDDCRISMAPTARLVQDRFHDLGYIRDDFIEARLTNSTDKSKEYNGVTFAYRRWPVYSPNPITTPQIRQLLRRNDPVILELGCHDGSDTERFLREFPNATIHCFEPDPRPLQRFRVNDRRCILHRVAISSQDGHVTWHQSGGAHPNQEIDDWDQSSSIHAPSGHLSAYPWVTFERSIIVEARSLDSWLHENRCLSVIDFLWADIQGAEGDLISGGRQTLRSHVRYLYTECYEQPMYEGQITRLQILALLPEFECIGVFESGHCLLLRNRALSLQPSRERLFFDIGAHDGLWTLANSASDVRIVSVEGSPITFERLRRNCEQTPRVVCVNCVVSDAIRDEMEFYHCEIDVLSTTQRTWLTAQESRFFGVPFTKMKCKSTTLDELIRIHGAPDLIKVDVEGAEFECLSSLTQKVSLLCFEWASETLDSTLKCLNHLLGLGFSEFALQHGDEYTFRPEEYTTIDNVRIALAKAVPKLDWGMIWCR